MRFVIVVPLLIALTYTLASADAPLNTDTPRVQQQLAKIDVKVLLSTYETLATMISETQIEIALVNGNDEAADMEQKNLSARLQTLATLKTRAKEHVLELQTTLDQFAVAEQQEVPLVEKRRAEPSNAPKYSKTSFRSGGLSARTR